ncbi:MAG: bifunctional phosphoglucose/phosphomannose isomerase [Candidatus Pacebacteria bacterium]|jgi:glucose/mannose-6-phosphate isomerase|nr:bifunctional phosphoglucose/phosphomannose isomerase [Candidatus Paceibacterota bacterium]|tara:strand:- start:4367 stop:5320 length:954 start_codon:yes stop_codon:yes gene_type:complete
MTIDAIKNFNKQFEYEPVIENKSKLGKKDKFIVAGMGGSHLAAGLLKIWRPDLDLTIHKDYGLPDVSDSLVILSSYSGNTEEIINTLEKGIENNLSMAIISTGGNLIELAKKHSLPYIQIPITGIQPRSALGYSIKALFKIMGEEGMLKELSVLANTLDPSSYQDKGEELAEKLKGKIPVIYSSAQNMSLAYNWKIKFNETGKIPAFYNIFSELNHNEIQGFDVKDSTKKLSQNFHFLILRDEKDNPRILKRMEVLKNLYKDRGLPVDMIDIEGKDKYHKVFASLVLADWTALNIAELYGLEAEQVPMIEEFKKLIK